MWWNREMENLILSLFPGVGLLDKGFEEEDFCVVRGPDVLWGAMSRDSIRRSASSTA